MSPETVASLDALTRDERAKVLDALDDYYWNDYIAVSRGDMVTSVLGPEGAPLPDRFLSGTIDRAEDALMMVHSTEPAWRIDVLEAIQDYLEWDDDE